MNLPPEPQVESNVREEIARLAAVFQQGPLGAYLRGFPDEERHLRSVMSPLNAIPVYRGWEDVLILTPDGSVLWVNTDRFREPEHVTDAGWRILAKIHAARAHPALGPLVPVRSVNSISCPECSGTGAITVGEVTAGCGVCWSLGWFLP